MKKKNLIVLLMIPFLISALTIVSVNVSYNYIDVDVSHIEWSYDDIEAFKVTDGKYVLNATGVNNRNHKVSEGNNLVWKVQNKTGDGEPNAEIVEESGMFYLKTLKQGEVVLTCSNAKGNVSRSFTAILYTNGVVYVQPVNSQSSFGKVDQTNYFGQYDLQNSEKINASFNVQVTAIPSSMMETISIETKGNATLSLDAENVDVSSSKAVMSGAVDIKGIGKVDINLSTTLNAEDISLGNYSFTVVENGINVYNFEDLLYCTNWSEKGEIAVLQCSFVAKQSQYQNNEKVFGLVDDKGNVDAKSFVQRIKTKYNDVFLKQWNEIATPDKQLKPEVVIGLRVKADMYGNGYMINFHNLAFPSSTLNGVPTTDPSDLFLGPLPFYTVGTPRGSQGSDMTNLNLISAYGQDNIGMYVDGDDILINDVVVKNCDDVESLSFLNTVGTVVEVDGDNVELRNMRISNGRQVVRSYSNNNLTMRNCRLTNARNFLFLTGANEYSQVNELITQSLYSAIAPINITLKDYLVANGDGNGLLKDYLNGTAGTDDGLYASKDELKKAIIALQNALTDESVQGDFKGSTEVIDCAFYRSGISAIALESLFNGPFLLSPDTPDNIAPFFQLLNSMLVGVDFAPRRISGTSYPVKVNLSGRTKFYDYKTWDQFDVSGLISESISALVKEILGRDGYSIDNIFPIKRILQNVHIEKVVEGKAYVNIPIAFYGGGANYSVVTTVGLDQKCMTALNGATPTDAIQATKVDLLDEYLKLPALKPASFGGGGGGLGSILGKLQVDHNTLVKTVTLVTGYQPFKFVFQKEHSLFGMSPSMEEMQQNATSYLGD